MSLSTAARFVITYFCTNFDTMEQSDQDISWQGNTESHLILVHKDEQIQSTSCCSNISAMLVKAMQLN